MTFKIGEEVIEGVDPSKFTEKDYSFEAELVKKIIQLTLPEISPQTDELKPTAAVICSQRQGILHRLEKNQPNQDKTFAGTYAVMQCVVVYAYNEKGDRFFGHIDSITVINWEKVFNHFIDKQDIKLILIGAATESAVFLLVRLMRSLYTYVSNNSEITLTIIKQKILSKNQFNPDDVKQKYQKLTLYLQNKLNNLSIEFFNKTLAENIPKEFKLNFANCGENFQEYCPDNLKEKLKEDSLGKLFIPLSEKGITSRYLQLEKFIKQNTISELVTALFTRSGYKALDNYLTKNYFWLSIGADMPDFIVNLETHTFIAVDFSQHNDPTKLLSFAKSLDKESKENGELWISFDGKKIKQEVEVEFSKKFIEKCKKYGNYKFTDETVTLEEYINLLTDFGMEVKADDVEADQIVWAAFKCLEIAQFYKKNSQLFIEEQQKESITNNNKSDKAPSFGELKGRFLSPKKEPFLKDEEKTTEEKIEEEDSACTPP